MSRPLEPRRPPIYKREPIAQNWYCLYCDHETANETMVLAHVRAAHESNPVAGEDYAIGSQVMMMNYRYAEWLTREIKRFQMILGFCQTPDDFLLECENDHA